MRNENKKKCNIFFFFLDFSIYLKICSIMHEVSVCARVIKTINIYLRDVKHLPCEQSIFEAYNHSFDSRVWVQYGPLSLYKTLKFIIYIQFQSGSECRSSYSRDICVYIPVSIYLIYIQQKIQFTLKCHLLKTEVNFHFFPSIVRDMSTVCKYRTINL